MEVTSKTWSVAWSSGVEQRVMQNLYFAGEGEVVLCVYILKHIWRLTSVFSFADTRQLALLVALVSATLFSLHTVLALAPVKKISRRLFKASDDTQQEDPVIVEGNALRDRDARVFYIFRLIGNLALVGLCLTSVLLLRRDGGQPGTGVWTASREHLIIAEGITYVCTSISLLLSITY